jgi:hypothetical protein
MEVLFALLVIVGVIAMVGVLVWVFVKNARYTKALRERGVPVSARVVGRMTTKSQRNGRSRTTYWLKLHYIANNAGQNRSLAVSKDAYNSFPVGSNLDILYLEEDPQVIMRKFPGKPDNSKST